MPWRNPNPHRRKLTCQTAHRLRSAHKQVTASQHIFGNTHSHTLPLRPILLGLNIQPEKSHRHLQNTAMPSAWRLPSAGLAPGDGNSQGGQAEGAAGRTRAEPIAAGSRERWAGNAACSSSQLGQKSAALERLSASGPTSRVKNRAVRRREKSEREREKTP